MHTLMLHALGVLAGWLLLCCRATLRFRFENDPRPQLRADGRAYVYAILHAQQLSFILVSDDVPILAMVSASQDGEWVAAICRARRIIPVRGSTRTTGTDKGGRAALAELAGRLRPGLPALMAVDGPRGPRNVVHWGVVNLARQTGASIVVAGVFAPASRLVLTRSWDRTQLPRPLSTLTVRFRPPIDPWDFADADSLRTHVAAELLALEQAFDPDEARHAGRVSPRDATRAAETDGA